MTIQQRCYEWDKSRNLLEYSAVNEFKMLHEELQEFMSAAHDDDEHEEIDALCDIIKVATSAIYKLGYDADKCLDECLKHIESREQDPIQKEVWSKWGADGKWQKNKEQTNVYQPDYSSCKLGEADAT